MLPFLEDLGFKCPGNYNPADFMLELASVKVPCSDITAPCGITVLSKWLSCGGLLSALLIRTRLESAGLTSRSTLALDPPRCLWPRKFLLAD